MQSECGKIQTRKDSVFGHFSRSEYVRDPLSFSKVQPKVPQFFRIYTEFLEFSRFKKTKLAKLTSLPVFNYVSTPTGILLVQSQQCMKV